MLIAYYFLLRIGEYSMSSNSGRTRTVQFRVQDVSFRKGDVLIPLNSPLEVLLSADDATLQIDNQKNGRRGQCIHHEANPESIHCPIQALAKRVHHILSYGGDNSTILCAYKSSHNQKNFHFITANTINKGVKNAIIKLGLEAQGFTPAKVSSHSLRAGGATTLKLHGYDRDTIRKYGRWSSDTFLTYIHEQISAFSAGVSKKMAQPIRFVNVATR